jgi:hypothetical protein
VGWDAGNDAGVVDAGNADAGTADAGDASCDLPVTVGPLATRYAWLATQLDAGVAKFERDHGGVGSVPVCPGTVGTSEQVASFVSYALGKLLVTSDDAGTGAAEAMLRCAFSFQYYAPDGGANDAGMPSGTFSFHNVDPPSVSDNSNEFALESLGAILLEHGERLSDPLKADLQPRLIAALQVVEGHNVCPNYTNICLMQSQLLVALGQYLSASSDPAVAAFGTQSVASGRARLEGWLALVTSSGITEFQSPTYYEVDVENIALGRHLAADATVRAEYDRALSAFLRDIAANFFFGSSTLAAPHSRTYDFFGGHGELDLTLYLLGLSPRKSGSGVALAKALVGFGADGGLELSPNARCLAAQSTRDIRTTWHVDGGAPGRERSVFISPDFAVGATSAQYFASLGSVQDLPVGAELGGGAASARITVLPDYLDGPGSSVTTGDFTKATHVQAGPVSAQSGGTVLALLKLPAKNPQYRGVPVVNLSTNLLGPGLADTDAGASAADEVLIDGAAWDGGSFPVDPSSHPTLTFRVGEGAVALSVISVSGVECSGAPLTSPTAWLSPMTGFSGSTRLSLVRLALYHSANGALASRNDCFARVAVLLSGRSCGGSSSCAKDLGTALKSAAVGAVESTDGGPGRWSVRANTPDGVVLFVDRLLSTDQTGRSDVIVARQADGQEMTFGPLRVNGVDQPF